MIALVVTIVILIILATITINLILNGGLIGKTSEAKFKHIMLAHKESVELYVADVLAGRILEGNTKLDRETIHAGDVLKEAIIDKVIENIKVEDVTINIKDIIKDIKKAEEKYIVVYEGTMYYVSNPNTPNNSQQEQWCREVGIPILSYVPPTGIVVKDGSYELVKDVYLCTPDLVNGFVKEKTRYLEVGKDGNMVPGNWITHHPSDNWYDYKNSQWANVYVESEGKEVYYVWIPRYCFKLDQSKQRSDVKLIDVDNSYKDKDGNLTTWEELQQEGYQVPEAFTFAGKQLPGYWAMKYTVADVTGASTINYDFSVANKTIAIKNITVNEEITNSNPIVRYTVALNGKIVKTINNVANIGSQVIEFTGLRAGDNTINLTGLNAKGEVVGSKTTEYEYPVPNEPDLSGFNKAVTFYVEYDAQGKETSTKPVTQTAPANWYDYGESRWANIVVRANGQEVYYVWIPRYEFKLNQDDQRSTVKFIPATKTTPSEGYQIPEAFTFGGKALSGYWAMKYTAGDPGEPQFSTEIVTTHTTIKTKGITGAGVTEGLKYNYYIDGKKANKEEITDASKEFEYTGLTANTSYTIMVEVRNSAGEYVGAYAKAVVTEAANVPDLSGFNEEYTYYVEYDENGENIVSEATKIKKDGSNMPEKWYDYGSSKWANIVVKANGATTYYVWIPRYEFKLEQDTQRSTVKFIETTKTVPTEGYQIPEAFTFGGKQLSGYWAMKYTVGE